MRVAVIGTGHVGLVTCASLASFGHDVVGLDRDAEKIAHLQQGTCPFYEPGLPELVEAGVAAGRLTFTTDPAHATSGAEAVFICVGTPARATGEANLVAIESVARDIVRLIDRDAVVIEKSTVPAGTAERIKRTIARETSPGGPTIHVVSNPEFLREGRGVEDSLHPERILVGADAPEAFEAVRRLYAPLVADGHLLIETDIATAEFAKHACNAFLALKISYANALARLCERAGADVVAVADVMGSDERIGRAFLNAGLGWGGYCFPKDLQAFDRLASRLGYDFPLLREVSRINDEAVASAADKVRDALWNLEGKRVALLGLSFKPETDDVRFSPALALARILIDESATVVGYDPQANSNAKAELPELELADSALAAAEGAHCVVLCTEWDEFAQLDLEKLKEVLAYAVVVDGRNLYEPETMRALGFTYHPMGRPPVL